MYGITGSVSIENSIVITGLKGDEREVNEAEVRKSN